MKKRKILAALGLAMTLVLSGCNSDSQDQGDSKETVISVNDTDITRDTLMFHIMQQEAEYSEYDTYYTASTGASYWDSAIDESGTTVRSQVQDYILEVAQMYEIFAQEAEKAGYEMTDEMKTEAAQNAAAVWDSMSDHQKEVTGLTKETLTKIYERISLGTKKFDEVEAGIQIDQDAVTATVNQDDYKEYSIQMMCLDKMEEVDEDGTMENVPEAKLKKALKRLKSYAKKVTKKKTLKKALPDNEKRIYVNEIKFIEGDSTLMDILEQPATKLKNGETTGVIDTENGYVVIQMIDNQCTDSYDEAVAAALEQAETDAFEAEFQKLKEQYKIEIKEDIWKDLTIGHLTIDDEEPESVNVTEAIE